MTTPATRPFGSVRPGSGAMFDRIADRYDLVNRVMTFGLDRSWRRKTVDSLDLRPGSRILDLATGTADMALEVLRRQPDAEVVGLDPSSEMLAIGQEKVRKRRLEGSITLREGRAESLPFEDDSFDGICMAYGIRNVADRPAALREMARVTRPDGRIAILEATDIRSGMLAPFARFHVYHVMPRLGALLSSSEEYRYLQSSITAFPTPEAFVELMADCGLESLATHSMTFGANTLFVVRPAEVRPAKVRPAQVRPAEAEPVGGEQ